MYLSRDEYSEIRASGAGGSNSTVEAIGRSKRELSRAALTKGQENCFGS